MRGIRVESRPVLSFDHPLEPEKPQNKNGLTETVIFPSMVRAVVSQRSHTQVTAPVALFLEFVSIVSSNLYTAPCLAFSQIADFSASVFLCIRITHHCRNQIRIFDGTIDRRIIAVIRNDLNHCISPI
jgi:hypothetical protein